jgi:GAF domain-containing protein
MNKLETYQLVEEKIKALLSKEDDWVSAMATVACELQHGFDYFHWTGFYRMVDERTLKIGPYQGSHGCLSIDISRGVCARAAREQTTQLVGDVRTLKDHIACSHETRSEIVIPICSKTKTMAVLDVDSNRKDAFDEIDKKKLEDICDFLSRKFFC